MLAEHQSVYMVSSNWTNCWGYCTILWMSITLRKSKNTPSRWRNLYSWHGLRRTAFVGLSPSRENALLTIWSPTTQLCTVLLMRDSIPLVFYFFVEKELVSFPRRNYKYLQKQKVKVSCKRSINTSLCSD